MIPTVRGSALTGTLRTLVDDAEYWVWVWKNHEGLERDAAQRWLIRLKQQGLRGFRQFDTRGWDARLAEVLRGVPPTEGSAS